MSHKNSLFVKEVEMQVYVCVCERERERERARASERQEGPSLALLDTRRSQL